ncbi:MAG: hypothetical protein K2Y02_03180 [Burkholderiaceae bacterium]|nr:hypothetical protein [Burkholderiaceae bacterium]
MRLKWSREMVSMKSEEAFSANGNVGSYADMLGIDAKGSNDWIEGGAGTVVLNGLGDFMAHVYAANDAIFTARSTA